MNSQLRILRVGVVAYLSLLAIAVPSIATTKGDYDGDGKADVAVFRPSSGSWFIIPSSNPGGMIEQQWGAFGDIPVPGDYDGDGKTDIAIWRPSTGTWFIMPSSKPGTFVAQQWGMSGDMLVPGDYDGDGKTDIAVWRPSTGTWFIIPSSNPGTFIAQQWGMSGDMPVPGDYDGDRKTDTAVWRPSTGTWFIIPSSNAGTFIAQQWGMSGDIPEAGDYDGDGKTDIAVWRPPTGTWFQLSSSIPTNIKSTQWGSSTDVPVTNSETQAQGLTITAVSSNLPLPATAIQLGTTGVDNTVPVIVQFSNSSGFSASLTAIRVQSDGTVVTAVPIYFDPASGNEIAGTVFVSISQRGQTSNPFPAPISIQVLSNDASSLPLGQLSHAFLNYQAMKIGRRLNELQAYQALQGNTVDTTAAQSTLQDLLRKTIEARNDVDRVALNPALVLSIGNLGNGLPLQFDQYSVTTMDRMYALQLAAMAPAINSVLSGKPLVVDAVGRRGGRVMNMHGHLLSRKRMAHGRASSLKPVANIDYANLASAIGVAGNLTAISQALSDYLHNTPGSTEQFLAIEGGWAGLFQLGTAAAPPGSVLQRGGALMGALVSGVGLLNNFALEVSDLAFIMVASRNGTDPSVIAEAQADLQKNADAALFNTINTEISLIGFGTGAPTSYWGAYGADVNAVLQSNGGQIAIQSAGLISAVGQCVVDATAGGSCLSQIGDVSTQLAESTASVFTTAANGFADVLGDALVSQSQSAFLSPDAGIQMGPFDGGIDLQTLADPTGNYDMFVPVGSPGTDYSAIMDTVYDPVSGTALATVSINLSTLTASAGAVPPTEPPIPVTCNDTDATNPDGDDPDCD
jgi:hypothetical protein